MESEAIRKKWVRSARFNGPTRLQNFYAAKIAFSDHTVDKIIPHAGGSSTKSFRPEPKKSVGG